MPLSDEEQKILKEIEAQLNATDPGLVEQVSRTTLYRHSARMIRWAALGVLAGLVLLDLHLRRPHARSALHRLPDHARLPARHRAQRAQARASRPADAHRRLARERRAARHLRRPGSRLARSLPPRRQLSPAWATPPRRRRGSPAARSRNSATGRAAASSRRPPTAAATRSAISSRCASCARCSTPGLSSTRVHAAVRWVRESGDDLASLRLVTDGRNVWACHDDGQILDALRAGQLALFVAVDQARGRRRRRGARVRRRTRRVRRAQLTRTPGPEPAARDCGLRTPGRPPPAARARRRCARIVVADRVDLLPRDRRFGGRRRLAARTSPRSAAARAPSTAGPASPAPCAGAWRSANSSAVADGRGGTPAVRSWSSASAHAPSTRRARIVIVPPAPARAATRVNGDRRRRSATTRDRERATTMPTTVDAVRAWCERAGAVVRRLHVDGRGSGRRSWARPRPWWSCAGRGRAGRRRGRVVGRGLARAAGAEPERRLREAGRRLERDPARARRSTPRARRARCGWSRARGRRLRACPAGSRPRRGPGTPTDARHRRERGRELLAEPGLGLEQELRRSRRAESPRSVSSRVLEVAAAEVALERRRALVVRRARVRGDRCGERRGPRAGKSDGELEVVRASVAGRDRVGAVQRRRASASGSRSRRRTRARAGGCCESTSNVRESGTTRAAVRLMPTGRYAAGSQCGSSCAMWNCWCIGVDVREVDRAPELRRGLLGRLVDAPRVVVGEPVERDHPPVGGARSPTR